MGKYSSLVEVYATAAIRLWMLCRPKLAISFTQFRVLTAPPPDLCDEHSVSDAASYNKSRAKYGGVHSPMSARLINLEELRHRLKKSQ